MQEDVRRDADGMIIQGQTLRIIEKLARRLGVVPIAALRPAVDRAFFSDEGAT